MKKIKKTLTVGLAVSAFVAVPEANTIGIKINGIAVNTTVSPYQSNGATLVPLRVISSNLGAAVEWDSSTQKIVITTTGKKIVLEIGSTVATVNGVEKTLTSPPEIKEGITMVPIRFISENLDCEVAWDDQEQMVIVISE